MPSTPHLDDSQVDLKSSLKDQQSQYDCLPCRLMGASAFMGLGAYTYISGTKQLRERELEIVRSGTALGMKARRGAILGLSLTMVGLGAYRMVN